MRPRYGIPLGLAATVAGGIAYGHVETKLFRLRRVEVPVLEHGARPLRVLQLSDIHMVPGQHKKIGWLRSLAALEPDFVINTGDNLSDPRGVEPVLDALEPLLRLPGVFVFGSNDYFAARWLNPARYLVHRFTKQDPSHRPRRKGPMNDWTELQEKFTEAGWLDLNNRRDLLKLDGRTIGFVGVDDPHCRNDRYATVSGGPDGSAEVTLGVVHAPYRRVLDPMVAEGLPFVIAGHTHGGQLRVPGYGALVTNCDLDRGRARGLSMYDAGGQTSYLHVSAGCGQSRYAPVRFACPPEATLLTLVERD